MPATSPPLEFLYKEFLHHHCFLPFSLPPWPMTPSLPLTHQRCLCSFVTFCRRFPFISGGLPQQPSQWAPTAPISTGPLPTLDLPCLLTDRQTPGTRKAGAMLPGALWNPELPEAQTCELVTLAPDPQHEHVLFPLLRIPFLQAVPCLTPCGHHHLLT